jgi:aerobic-type carbon monoxide dehydrogenase small subunit (CoxS/CutS family)
MIETISFQLNGRRTSLEVDGERKLLWVLRQDLGLTGTKFGCGESVCGACTVVVDREPVRSCQLTMREARGKEILTIEGLAHGGALHQLQQEFIEHGALQCGFCTPGMIMSAYGMLLANSKPTRDQIVESMDGNLCRCAAYQRILQAVEAVAGGM